MVGLYNKVGEITATTTRHQYLFPDLVGLFKHNYPAPALSGGDSTEKASGPRPEDNDIAGFARALEASGLR